MYKKIANVDSGLEIRFNFTLSNLTNPDGLMLYLGNKVNKRRDYFVVGIQDGHIVYKYDLGSGPAVIRSLGPVNMSLIQHSIQLGRNRQNGWMTLDNQSKLTGRSKGNLVGLNVDSYLYVGGLETFSNEDLPLGVDFTNGFSGCLYDIEVRTDTSWYELGSADVISGRNVQQCGLEGCSLQPCYNKGICIDIGASVRCDCVDGYTGVLCADTVTPCDGLHNCTPPSLCQPLPEGGYKCLCVLGQYGTYCEHNITITKPLFVGQTSYMAFRCPQSVHQVLDIKIEFKSTVSTGLLLYIANLMAPTTKDFVSVEIYDRRVSLRYNTGTRDTTVITSRNSWNTDKEWHTLNVGRNTTHGYVYLDGVKTEGAAKPGFVNLDLSTPLYLGGVPDLSLISPFAVQNEAFTFEGCIRHLVVNGEEFVLNEKGAIDGLDVYDCDGTACGHGICYNGGTCVTLDNHQTVCNCTQGFVGVFCDQSVTCVDNLCQNGATCIPDVNNTNYTCLCQLGTEGDLCQHNTTLYGADFSKPSSFFVLNTTLNATTSYVSLNVLTNKTEGLLVWTGEVYSKTEDYFGIGISEGHLKVVMSLGWSPELVITSDTLISDNRWHKITVYREATQLSVYLDSDVYVAVIPGHYTSLDTDSYYYIGGFGRTSSVRSKTRSLYKESYLGCISQIHIGRNQTVDILLTAVDGADITSCDGT